MHTHRFLRFPRRVGLLLLLLLAQTRLNYVQRKQNVLEGVLRLETCGRLSGSTPTLQGVDPVRWTQRWSGCQGKQLPVGKPAKGSLVVQSSPGDEPTNAV
jgi:hypothetical protein